MAQERLDTRGKAVSNLGQPFSTLTKPDRNLRATGTPAEIR